MSINLLQFYYIKVINILNIINYDYKNMLIFWHITASLLFIVTYR